MNLRRTLSWNRQICAIEHGLFSSHVVIDDLEHNDELSDHNLTLILLVPEECQVLPDTNALSISELAHHLSELDYALTEESSTAVGGVTLIGHDKRSELQLRVLRHLDLCDRQEERVRRENWILHGCRDISSPFLTISIELQGHEVVELFGELEVLQSHLQVALLTYGHQIHLKCSSLNYRVLFKFLT